MHPNCLDLADMMVLLTSLCNIILIIYLFSFIGPQYWTPHTADYTKQFLVYGSVWLFGLMGMANIHSQFLLWKRPELSSACYDPSRFTFWRTLHTIILWCTAIFGIFQALISIGIGIFGLFMIKWYFERENMLALVRKKCTQNRPMLGQKGGVKAFLDVFDQSSYFATSNKIKLEKDKISVYMFEFIEATFKPEMFVAQRKVTQKIRLPPTFGSSMQLNIPRLRPTQQQPTEMDAGHTGDCRLCDNGPEELIIPTCYHGFHKLCLRKALNGLRMDSCPICYTHLYAHSKRHRPKLYDDIVNEARKIDKE